MPFVNVRDLHDRTAEILRIIKEGDPVFVTRYGKPIAVIRDLAEGDLEGLAMLSDPKLRKGLEEARADVTAGRVSDLDDLLEEPHQEIDMLVRPIGERRSDVENLASLWRPLVPI